VNIAFDESNQNVQESVETSAEDDDPTRQRLNTKL